MHFICAPCPYARRIDPDFALRVIPEPPDDYDKGKLENGVLEPLRELGLVEDD